MRTLMAQAQLVGFENWQGLFLPQTLDCLKAANGDKRFLSDEDLVALRHWEGDLPGLDLVPMLRDEAPRWVDEARLVVLERFPDILLPGGALFPQERAIACWRDLWHFLRAVSYGVAMGRSDFTSDSGVVFLGLLYERLQVPLEPMCMGVDALKEVCLRSLVGGQQDGVRTCFEHLRVILRSFQK